MQARAPEAEEQRMWGPPSGRGSCWAVGCESHSPCTPEKNLRLRMGVGRGPLGTTLVWERALGAPGLSEGLVDWAGCHDYGRGHVVGQA